MADRYRIGIDTFALWEGPPPPFTREVVTQQTAAGKDGIQLKKAGEVTLPVRVTLTAHLNSYANAMLAAQLYHLYPGLGPQPLIYEGIDYVQDYSHFYSFLDPVLERVYAAHICGPGYQYTNGGVVKISFSVLGHEI